MDVDNPKVVRNPIIPEIFEHPLFIPNNYCVLEKGVQTVKANMWHKLELCGAPSNGFALLVIGRNALSICNIPIMGQMSAPFENPTCNPMVDWPFRVKSTDKVAVYPRTINGAKGMLIELKGAKEIEIFFTRLTSTVSSLESANNYSLKDVRGWQLEMRHIDDVERPLALPLPLKVVYKLSPKNTATRCNTNIPESLISKLKKMTHTQLKYISTISDAFLGMKKDGFDSEMSITGPSSTEEDSDEFPGDLCMDIDA